MIGIVWQDLALGAIDFWRLFLMFSSDKLHGIRGQPIQRNKSTETTTTTITSTTNTSNSCTSSCLHNQFVSMDVLDLGGFVPRPLKRSPPSVSLHDGSSQKRAKLCDDLQTLRKVSPTVPDKQAPDELQTHTPRKRTPGAWEAVADAHA